MHTAKMTGAHTTVSERDARRRAAIRTAVLLGVVALALYIGFIAMAVLHG